MVVPGPMVKVPPPLTCTLPPTWEFVNVRLPPLSFTFPVTPPLVIVQFWPGETVTLPVKVPL